jgi:hypothetical protein
LDRGVVSARIQAEDSAMSRRSSARSSRREEVTLNHPIFTRWPAQYPDRLQVFSTPTPNGVKVGIRGVAGSLYGRRMYEVMRYWDEDRPEWDAIEHDFAAVWRAQPKWVASRSLKAVGANATLVGDNLEAFARQLKAEVRWRDRRRWT